MEDFNGGFNGMQGDYPPFKLKKNDWTWNETYISMWKQWNECDVSIHMTDLTMYAFLYCLFMEFNNDV